MTDFETFLAHTAAPRYNDLARRALIEQRKSWMRAARELVPGNRLIVAVPHGFGKILTSSRKTCIFEARRCSRASWQLNRRSN